MSAENPTNTNNNDVETPFQEEEEKGGEQEKEPEEEEGKWTNRSLAMIALTILLLLGLLIFLLLYFLRDNGGVGDPEFPPKGVGDTEAPTTLRPTRSPTTSPSSSPSHAPTVITLPPVSTGTICPEYYASLALLTTTGTNDTFVSSNRTITEDSSLLLEDTWIQVAQDIPGETAMDFSGAALAVSANGKIVAVAAAENDGNGRNAGSVRVFQLTIHVNDTLQFQQLGQDLDGEAQEDWFGESLTMDASGYRLAVGAGWNDGDHADQQDYNAGHVRIFDYNFTSEVWEVMEEIHGPHMGDEFGKSVSLSADGTRLAVGASHCRGSLNLTKVGCAYLFELDEVEGWLPLGEVLEGEAEGDEFGTTAVLSEDGSSLAVGAYRHDVGLNGTDAGQVSLFTFDTISESFEPNGIIEGELPSEWVGMAIAMSQDGSRVAIGYYDREVSPVPGFTRVYEQYRDRQIWEQIGTKDLLGGFAVSMSRDGSRIAVGDHRGRTGGANSGYVNVFDFNEAAAEWEATGPVISGNEQEMLGISVELTADGQRVVITAPFASVGGVPQVGATRMYDLCTPSEAVARSKMGFEAYAT